MSASSYHLRPVSSERSASPSTSTSTRSGHSPPPQILLPPQSASAARHRRPMSPSSLRELDLSHERDPPSRKYPAPPTGHELMALFPPAPPANFHAGPTSGYFQREERAFFAKAGKEIVRVRIELEMAQDAQAAESSSRREASRQWTHSQSTLPALPMPPPDHVPSNTQLMGTFPHPNNGRSRAAPAPTSQPSFPAMMHSHASQPPQPSQPNLHSLPPASMPHPGYTLRTPAQDPRMSGKPMEPRPEEFRDDPDESWRRPMPHNERRRAGKHTKRVIVK